MIGQPGSTSTDRPSCWGNKFTYDPDDDECESCRFQHTCRAEVQRNGYTYSAPRKVIPTSSPTPTTSYRPNYNSPRRDDRHEIERTNWDPGITHPDESPVHRFAKDAFAGGLRGMFYEMYRFFRDFRFR